MEIQEGPELCFPQLLNDSCRKPTLHYSKTMLLYIVMSCISLITTALNLLVIISVSHFRQLHTPSNILLLSLAVSDFLVGLLLMPLEILRSTTCWVLGDFMCFLYWYLTGNITCVSIGNIVLISVDRYVAICDPLHYSTRITVAKVKLSVCLCWFYAIFSIILYMRVFVVAVSQARAMPPIVISLFFSNSCLNPVIYALFYPWFRKALKLIVTLQILHSGSCEVSIL
ncbi:insulin-like growth factor-binding protein 6 [Sarotherodon galilaeus]